MRVPGGHTAAAATVHDPHDTNDGPTTSATREPAPIAHRRSTSLTVAATRRPTARLGRTLERRQQRWRRSEASGFLNGSPMNCQRGTGPTITSQVLFSPSVRTRFVQTTKGPSSAHAERKVVLTQNTAVRYHDAFHSPLCTLPQYQQRATRRVSWPTLEGLSSSRCHQPVRACSFDFTSSTIRATTSSGVN